MLKQCWVKPLADFAAGLCLLSMTAWPQQPGVRPIFTSKFIRGNTPTTICDAQRDFAAYRAFFLKPNGRNEPLSANALENLWESAFVYRDRKGAALIAAAVREQSPFWYSCFEALSAGADLKPAKLSLLRPSDVPTPRMAVFTHLFTLHELRSCPNQGVHLYAELITKVWDDARQHENLGPHSHPATTRDSFLLVQSSAYWTQGAGTDLKEDDPSYAKWVSVDKKLNAAETAYEACAYRAGDKFLKAGLASITRKSDGETQVGPWYSGDLPYVLYMSGHSLYRINKETLRTDNGRIVHLAPFSDQGWVNFLLSLSKERDEIFKLRRQQG